MIRVGIFFGGQSREREVSFAGGRTIYDNLDKSVFEPIAVFVDGLGRFILLDWKNIYKGTIRDFYPPAAWQGRGGHPYQYYIDSFADLPAEELDAMANAVGTPVTADKISTLIDFAFLTLHGPYGEDGAIQGLLEWYGIPYSGSGILPSAIGIDKLVQNGLMAEGGFARPKHIVLKRAAWLGSSNRIEVLQSVTTTLGLPLVIKAPRQGSSIGVTVLSAKDDALFAHAVNKAFFVEELPKQAWRGKSAEEKQVWLHQLIDIRSGLGLPIAVSAGPGGAISPSFLQKHQGGPILFYLADALAEFLDSGLYTGTLLLESPDGEDAIFFEEFIKGREFSCIVVRGEQGQAIALPPTEIIKKSDIFDYRAKYLPGISRKVTPIDLDEQRLELIKRRCKDLFEALRFNVYARIDGFITAGGEVFLNDPNTTSGMLPSSFFFHQAAEIGLNPSQFVTYIIRASLAERLQNGKRYIQNRKLLEGLDMQIANMQTAKSGKTRVAVIMGGYSAERHISVESGRNVFEKLASSGFYEVTPVFLTGSDEEHQLYKLPINVMLKDNADDIREKVLARDKTHLALERIREEAQELTLKYAGHAITKPVAITYLELSRVVDVVFIALHGRPGEDGAVQAQLERYGIPYNGSGQASSRTTINKYDTNELLARHGVLVAKHALISKLEFTAEPATAIGAIESQFSYPFIAKPCDDGCSAAVKKIKNRDELAAFAALIFRAGFALHEGHAYTLHLQANEEFPRKDVFMVEDLISANGAARFLEITGGLYTSYDDADNLQYHVFEPSEALAGGEVLSLEEKFLAGEGQNITPARFSADPARQAQISAAVRMELEKVARIVGVEGYCRTDAFVRIYGDGRVETVIIEVNSLPGMTPATCIFHQAAIADMRPFDFIDAILSFGRKRALLPV